MVIFEIVYIAEVQYIMEEFYKPLLNKIYEIRSVEFEEIFAEEHNKELENNGTLKKEKKLYAYIKKIINSNDNNRKIYKLIQEFEDAYVQEIMFWTEKYYKLGFSDAFKLEKEITDIEDYNNINFFNEKEFWKRVKQNSFKKNN